MTAIADQSNIDGAWGLAIAFALLFAAIIVGWSMDRRTKSHRAASGGTSNTEAARPTNKCAGYCGSAPVQKYRGKNYCRECADELAAYDQRLMERERAREIQALEALWRGEVS